MECIALVDRYYSLLSTFSAIILLTTALSATFPIYVPSRYTHNPWLILMYRQKQPDRY